MKHLGRVLLVGLLVLGMVGTVSAQEVSSEVYLPMNDSSAPLQDFSGNGNDASLVEGNPTYGVEGAEGDAVGFNGGEIFDFGDVVGGSQNDYSIAGWVEFDDTTSRKIVHSNGYLAAGIVCGNGDDIFTIRALMSQGDACPFNDRSAGKINVQSGEKYHFAATFDESEENITFYWQGSYQDSVILQQNGYQSFNDDYKIGGSIANDRHHNGWSDELYSANRVFSASEVQDLYQLNNEAPVFDSVSASPSPLLIGETGNFSYSASDSDGSISSVELTLKDDGTQVFTGSKSSASGTFNPSVNLTQGDITAEFTATDNDGATTTDTLTRTLVDNRGTLTVNSPSGSVSNPERFFDYDVPVSVTHTDNDNNPNETITLDFDFVRDLDPGFTTDKTVNITEGETFTTSFRQEISNINEFRVNFNDQTQSNPDINVDNFFNVTDFAITGVSGADTAFETESRQFNVNFRTGDMVNTDGVASKFVYNGSESVNPYFPNPSSTGSNTASAEVPLVKQNQTDLEYKFSLKYNATKFSGGTEIRTENSSTQIQTVLQSYFIEDTSTPPRNGDYIETENLQHKLQVHTQTKKADLTGSTTYERNQKTSQMQETTVAQDLNQFKGEVDTGLADNFNKSKFNVSSEVQVSFEGDTRTLEARDEIEVYRIQITDGSTNLDTEKTLNFDIDSEETGNSVKAKFQADFSVWKNRDQKIRRFNFQKPAKKEHDFFIYPSWAEYNLRTLNYPNQQKFDLIQFFNEDTNKVKRSYFFPQVQTVNNDTTTVPLKTINRSETRLIDFEMSNSEGDPAEDVYCRVDRKFAGGNFQTSFVFNTNSEGKAEAAAETTGTFYGLKCFKDGELIETFSAQKLQDPVRLQFGAAAETTRLNFFEKFDSACTTGTTFVNCSYQSQSEKLEKAVLDVERQEIVQDVNVCTEKGSTATGRLVCTGLNTSKEKYKFDVQAQYPDTTVQGTVGFTGTKQASIPFSGLFMTAIIFMLVTSASAYNITIGIGAGTLTMLLMSIIEFITLTPGQRATLIAVAIIAGVAIQR